ncbi:MAG: lipid-A-disaccharide synthase [Armatimonadetes bacterium]|nr:lipid-A-disaccharide synthase [Armatimonadota bacterium]
MPRAHHSRGGAGQGGPRRVVFVAGEVSGDAHGADLARELRALDPTVRLEGVGGLRMAAAGVSLIEDSSAWGVIGWFEAARHLRPFLRRLRTLAVRLRANPPDVLVPIDFPGFNLALLKRVRGCCPAVYYVPPMVSVRRGRRAARVAALGARLLAVFPFEADAYRRAGANVTFVGHPAIDHIRAVEPADAVRRGLSLTADAPVLGLLPGSRRQELALLLPPMLEAARRVLTAQPAVRLLLSCASPIFRAEIEAAVAASGLPITVVDGGRDVMAASTVVLLASGTATVEAMLLGVPMVVVYRASWSTWWLANLIKAVPWAALPNILAREVVVPELLQRRAAADAMSAAALDVLTHPEARERMRRRLLDLAEALGPPGASRRAAAEVLAAMGAVTLKAQMAIK